MNTITLRNNAKTALIEALKENDGDTKNEVVVAAIEKLASLNPNPVLTENIELLQGNWLLINAPNFPDRLPDEQNRYIYTLGRLAFNMFEPVKLKVEIERVLQPVFPTGKENEFTHDIVVEFHTCDRSLKGIVKNLAVCSLKDKDTLQVQFTGGELIPTETQNSEQNRAWQKVFNQNSPTQLSFVEQIKFLFIKWMFGIGKVFDLDTQTGKKAFTMKKSPKGDLKILYLDEELRITKGNRETVLVCQRLI